MAVYRVVEQLVIVNTIETGSTHEEQGGTASQLAVEFSSHSFLPTYQNIEYKCLCFFGTIKYYLISTNITLTYEPDKHLEKGKNVNFGAFYLFRKKLKKNPSLQLNLHER